MLSSTKTCQRVTADDDDTDVHKIKEDVALVVSKDEENYVGLRYEIIDGYKHSRFTLNCLLFIAAACCWAFGALEGLSEKIQDNVSSPRCGDVSNEHCSPAHFKGPFFQNWCMCLAESTGLIMHLFQKFLRKHQLLWIFDLPVTTETSSRPKCPWYLWYIPSVGDIGTMLCVSYAFLYVRTSTSSIIINSLMVLMGGFTMWTSKRALRWYQWGATILVTIGAVLSSIKQVEDPEEQTNRNSEMAAVGIFLSVASGLFQMFQMLMEEYLMKKYDISAMEAIGTEGAVGVSTSSVLLLIAHYFQWEDVRADFYQVFHSQRLGGAVVIMLIAIAGSNFGGIHVTKLGNAVTRSVIGACKTPLLWTVEVAFGLNQFDPRSFSGVLCTGIGAFWYIDILKFWWFPKLDKALHQPASCGCRLEARDYYVVVPEDSNEKWIDKRDHPQQAVASTGESSSERSTDD